MKETIDAQERYRVFSLINKDSLTNFLSKNLKTPVYTDFSSAIDTSEHDYQLLIQENYEKFRFYFEIKPKYIFQLMQKTGKSPQNIGSFLTTRMLVNYLNGNILKDMEDKDENVWKLSSELNVSSFFSDNLGFPESKDFDLPKGMSAEYYYEELMKKLNNSNNSSSEDSSYDNLEFLRNEKVNQDINEAISNLPNSSSIDKTEAEAKDGVKDISEIMSDISYESEVEKIVDKICKNIVVEERKEDIVPMQKKSSYYSINKKHMNSSVILPGKRYERTGTTKKFNKTGVIFVDVSGSTARKYSQKKAKVPIEFIIQEVARLLQEKYGLQIIYYSNYINGIIKNSEDFYYCDSIGGTSIVNVFEKYMELEKLQSIERLYVISDGLDDYEELFIKHKNKVIQNKPQVYIIKPGITFDGSVNMVINERGELKKL